ncbi:DNA replication/repair protein RecF [Alteromonas sp. ASW11-130]|uniref:DNA replication/repair protein RecF n=1 Tax=Alteromonas sp. ASW11-130 TaxID=3015775 RepID=UPI002242414F|nr:DNA replication/repair protein RecF [Alteromonas sp. ASW11-130]MCW8093436.1 DNA replication/repair protein RecF [Alteromonas sp. ASW11-130]
MKLAQVQISNFRNISSACLNLSPSLSVIRGQNGSGKSSLLEAIYYLGYGRSFRTNKHESVIKEEQSSFSVFAKCDIDNSSPIKVGIQRTRTNEVTCNVNGEHSKKLSDLVSLVPVQLFTPQSTDLLVGSPSDRRRFIDWGVFHVEQSFQAQSRTYQLLLKQRNAIIKKGDDLTRPEHSFWTEKLKESAEFISLKRQQYIQALIPYFKSIMEQFLPEFCVEIAYYRGWDKHHSFEEALQRKRDYDYRVGYTSVGPHKADLKIKVNSVSAQEMLSRGQLRMTVAALQLAQTKLFNAQSQRQSIFLLDDIGAELDSIRREKFLTSLLETNTQVVVTAIVGEMIDFVKNYNDKRMFHVEHGIVKEESN